MEICTEKDTRVLRAFILVPFHEHMETLKVSQSRTLVEEGSPSPFLPASMPSSAEATGKALNEGLSISFLPVKHHWYIRQVGHRNPLQVPSSHPAAGTNVRGTRCCCPRPRARLEALGLPQPFVPCTSGPSCSGSVYCVAAPWNKAFENIFWLDTYLSILKGIFSTSGRTDQTLLSALLI